MVPDGTFAYFLEIILAQAGRCEAKDFEEGETVFDED
jgi:hypothetical protein